MTANEIEHALAASRDDVAALLLSAREDQWFDRKSIRVTGSGLSSALTAFANAEGGVIVVGLHAGKCEGIDRHRGKVNELRQASIDHTEPPVRIAAQEVACVNSDDQPDHLLVMRIDPSEVLHQTKNGDCFLRIGDESRKLNFLQRQELTYDKGQSQYDGLALPGIGIPDLDGKLLQQYKSSTGARPETNILNLLKARSLLTRRGEVTHAGYLLFGKEPGSVFPQAHIRVTKYLTADRGTGARLNLDENNDHRFEGPIPHIIETAQAKITELVPQRRVLGADGRFVAQPVVPRDAWLEGLVNAVIHRSYSLAGDHIRVEIFPNRIEIQSPGRFAGLANPSKPLEISRFARNPRIARVCADLRIGQELGEGIKRIFDEMRLVGLTDPIYQQGAGSVRLTLEAVHRVPTEVAARLPTGSQRLLDVLRQAGGPLGTGDIRIAVGLSRPAVTSRLAALQAEGLVEWSGKSPKDPRAVWQLPQS